MSNHKPSSYNLQLHPSLHMQRLYLLTFIVPICILPQTQIQGLERNCLLTLPALLPGTLEEEAGYKWDETFRIPVMENLHCRPGGGQLFREFRCEPCALRVDLLKERSIIPLRGVPSGAREEPSPASGYLRPLSQSPIPSLRSSFLFP